MYKDYLMYNLPFSHQANEGGKTSEVLRELKYRVLLKV